MAFKTPISAPPWQRLVLSLVGILLIQGSWRWAVAHLYTLPPAALAGFVSITTNSFYVIGAIVIFMVTGRLIYEWKMGTQQVQDVVSRVEEIKEEITEKVIKPKYFDDSEIP
jgi:hypothetical protein